MAQIHLHCFSALTGLPQCKTAINLASRAFNPGLLLFLAVKTVQISAGLIQSPSQPEGMLARFLHVNTLQVITALVSLPFLTPAEANLQGFVWQCHRSSFCGTFGTNPGKHPAQRTIPRMLSYRSNSGWRLLQAQPTRTGDKQARDKDKDKKVNIVSLPPRPGPNGIRGSTWGLS